MNVLSAIKWGESELSFLREKKIECEVLLANVLKKNRIFLRLNETYELSKKEEALFKKYIKYRKERLPVAYITHQKNWGSLTLYINKNVLIPRDETEVLCEHIKKETEFSPKKILDVGTGSGNIAIFLKKKFPKASVIAVDKCSRALQVAQKNGKNEKVEIVYKKSDLLKNFPQNEYFDIIVANLPYVPTTIILEKEVLQEPQKAIVSGEDGLMHIRRFANELKLKRIKWKTLYLEFLPQQKKAIQKIFEPHQIKFLGDVSGDIFFAKIVFSDASLLLEKNVLPKKLR